MGEFDDVQRIEGVDHFGKVGAGRKTEIELQIQISDRAAEVGLRDLAHLLDGVLRQGIHAQPLSVGERIEKRARGVQFTGAEVAQALFADANPQAILEFDGDQAELMALIDCGVRGLDDGRTGTKISDGCGYRNIEQCEE